MPESLERIKIGDEELFGIMSPCDTTPHEALVKAGEMIEHGTYYDIALVDSEQGLIIFDPGKAYREEFEDELTGFRLQSLHLGDDENVSLTSGVVLSLFGFGRPEVLYDWIGTATGTCIRLSKDLAIPGPQ